MSHSILDEYGCEIPTRASDRRNWLFVLVAASLAGPWAFFFFHGIHPDPQQTAVLTGLAILGAAFLLAWGAEAFQVDVSQAFALALLALIAVLPEYAVDAVFAWKSALDPAYASYPVANMTGANRLLIGVGWSVIVLVGWLRFGFRRVELQRSNALELGTLLAASIYSVTIPLKGSLSLVDTVVLGSLFGFYIWNTSRMPAEEPHLVGPACTISQLPTWRRRGVTYGLFAYAAAVIYISAHPFAEGLVETGFALGIDEFLLVQWLAPLASESPEFLVAILFAWRAQAVAGLRVMVSSTVNQWTLLVATLPLVYSIAKGGPDAMPLDHRQTQELVLTTAQSLFALFLAARFALSRVDALLLFGLFAVQLVLPTETVRTTITVIYFLLCGYLVVRDSRVRKGLLDIVAEVRPSFLGGSSGRMPGDVAEKREA